jgi:hypothetical protein
VLADLTETRAAATCAALAEIERLAALIPAAPQLSDRMALADLVARRYARYRALLESAESVRDPRSGMAAASPALDEARLRVSTGEWWEGLAAVALCAPLTDELFGALVGEAAVPADEASDAAADAAVQWATDRLRTALAEDAVLAARIAMWSRRLVGESIVLARVFGGERYAELADALAVGHLRRVTELGVSG